MWTLLVRSTLNKRLLNALPCCSYKSLTPSLSCTCPGLVLNCPHCPQWTRAFGGTELALVLFSPMSCSCPHFWVMNHDCFSRKVPYWTTERVPKQLRAHAPFLHTWSKIVGHLPNRKMGTRCHRSPCQPKNTNASNSVPLELVYLLRWILLNFPFAPRLSFSAHEAVWEPSERHWSSWWMNLQPISLTNVCNWCLVLGSISSEICWLMLMLWLDYDLSWTSTLVLSSILSLSSMRGPFGNTLSRTSPGHVLNTALSTFGQVKKGQVKRSSLIIVHFR